MTFYSIFGCWGFWTSFHWLLQILLLWLYEWIIWGNWVNTMVADVLAPLQRSQVISSHDIGLTSPHIQWSLTGSPTWPDRWEDWAEMLRRSWSVLFPWYLFVKISFASQITAGRHTTGRGGLVFRTGPSSWYHRPGTSVEFAGLLTSLGHNLYKGHTHFCTHIHQFMLNSQSLDQFVKILLMTFSRAFCEKKMKLSTLLAICEENPPDFLTKGLWFVNLVFWLKFYWLVFLRV